MVTIEVSKNGHNGSKICQSVSIWFLAPTQQDIFYHSLPFFLSYCFIDLFNMFLIISGRVIYRRPEMIHCGFLKHWNSQKSLCNIWQCFSCLLDESIEKKWKKKKFHGGLFFKSTLSVLRCTWTGRIIWKKFWDIILTI